MENHVIYIYREREREKKRKRERRRERKERERKRRQKRFFEQRSYRFLLNFNGFWVPGGSFLGALGGSGPLFGPREHQERPKRPQEEVPGALLGSLGDPLGPNLGPPRANLGPSWTNLAPTLLPNPSTREPRTPPKNDFARIHANPVFERQYNRFIRSGGL